MMNRHIAGILVILLIGITVLSGCIDQATDKTHEKTATATPSGNAFVTTTSSTITKKVTTPSSPRVTANVTPNTTPPAEPDPTDIAKIQFVHYTDNDFSLEYPKTWSVTNSTYTSYVCNSVQKWCYQKQVKTIGPFDFSNDDNRKRTSRIVTFTSADRTQKVVAFTSDIADSRIGNYKLKPTLEWCQERVSTLFPGVVGSSAVGYYQYGMSGNTMASTYTVILPNDSASYPLAYTMKDFVTVHHIYEFAFISDNVNIQKYQNLRDRILLSIIPNDQV